MKKAILAFLCNLEKLIFRYCGLTLLGFEELFEEFQASHLRDELLMLLGFLSFKGFPGEKLLCTVC